jgi:membrane protease YdiL (CAAX protease family)
VDTPTDTRAGFDQSFGDFANESAPPAPGGSTAHVNAPAVDPDNPSWGILFGIGATVAFFLFQAILQLAFVIPYVLTFRTADRQALLKILESDKAILLTILANFPAHFLTLGLAWMIVTGVGKRPFWRSLGWNWSPRFGYWEALACFGLTVLLLGSGQLFARIFGDPETPLERIILSSTATRYAVAVLATFTAPLVEEVVFRGVLYSGLRKRMGAAWGAIIVIAIFAAIHVPQYRPSVAAILTILLLSSVLTAVRARTGRLLPCVTIHFLFNGISSVFIVLAPYFKHTLPPPSPAPPLPPAPGALVELCARVVTIFF